MITKQKEEDIYIIDLDEGCNHPIPAKRMVSDPEFDAGFDFPESNHFKWHYTGHRRDFKDLHFEFSGHGTLSPIESTILLLYKASKKTGGYVRMKPDFSYCPYLPGTDLKPVFLSEVVEAIDGLIDYDEIKEDLPTLSIAQIGGAIAFLRKVAQFNSDDVDLDELEDSEIFSDQNFLGELRAALEDKETMRVLNSNERDIG